MIHAALDWLATSRFGFAAIVAPFTLALCWVLLDGDRAKARRAREATAQDALARLHTVRHLRAGQRAAARRRVGARR